jgi:arylsulfatase A-like enzyme
MNDRATRRWMACLALGLMAAGFQASADEHAEVEVDAEGGLQGAVLIVLDTLRADRLSSYGYARPTSPHLDALAKRGVRFKQVVAPSPWTLPSTASLLSAEHPSRIFARGPKLVSSQVERIERAGISTAAFTEGAYVSREFRLDRGFEHWIEEESAVRTNQAADATGDHLGGIEKTFGLARDWLVEHRDERFFVFIQTYEVHTPYRRHTFTSNLDPGRIGSELSIEDVVRIVSGKWALTNAEVEYIKALYDGGVLEADRHVGELLELLRSLGLDKRTLVVVTSDHGEELDDHYRAHTGDHGHSLRDPLLLVPLIVHDPSRTWPAREVSAQVRLFDVLPTMLDLLGLGNKSDVTIDGRSLVPYMKGAERADRFAFAAFTKKGPLRVAIRDQGFKYIEEAPGTIKIPVSPRPPLRQLYDLRADPLEKRNLAEEQPDLVHSMADTLEALLATLDAPAESVEPEVSDPELIERLKSLGYIVD